MTGIYKTARGSIKKRLTGFVLAALVSGSLAGQVTSIPSSHENAIRLLIEETGALEIGTQFAEAVVIQMSQNLRQARRDIDPRAFEILREEVLGTINEQMESGSFEAKIIPVYAKYFSEEEVEQLLAFYRTDIGRKTIEVMPTLTQESMEVGQAWGIAIGPLIGQRVSERLAREGIEID